jgi:hypothetical protein
MSSLDFYIPQLPEGWALHQLQERWIAGGKTWHAVLYRPTGAPDSVSADGKSPREAILRCLDEVGKDRNKKLCSIVVDDTGECESCQ